MESFDAITHHTYFYDHTQCDFAPRTDDGDGDFVINLLNLVSGRVYSTDMSKKLKDRLRDPVL